jgi:hypothetical protein
MSRIGEGWKAGWESTAKKKAEYKSQKKFIFGIV